MFIHANYTTLVVIHGLCRILDYDSAGSNIMVILNVLSFTISWYLLSCIIGNNNNMIK